MKKKRNEFDARPHKNGWDDSPLHMARSFHAKECHLSLPLSLFVQIINLNIFLHDAMHVKEKK